MRRCHAIRGLAALALLATLTACSTQQRHAVLTFFFEGVPPLDGPAVAPATTPEPSTPPPAPLPLAPPPVAVVTRLPHKPYVERKCNACHTPDHSQSLKGTARDICLACHEKVLTKGMAPHWPAAKGMCSECHRSHESPFEHLLVKPLPTLCADCHDLPYPGRYVHFPVKRGRCLSCHTAHQAPQAGLLREQGDALCLRCHASTEMVALAAHADTGGKTCVKCHDPHASNKKGLIK